MKLMRLYPNEEFKEITIADKLKLRYAISNKGRLMSFVEDIKFGRELKGSITDGYRLFRYKIYTDGKIKNKHLFFYKLVAEYFIPKTSEYALLNLLRCSVVVTSARFTIFSASKKKNFAMI